MVMHMTFNHLDISSTLIYPKSNYLSIGRITVFHTVNVGSNPTNCISKELVA